MEDNNQENKQLSKVDKIELLEKQIDQIQLKVFSKEKSKWYKNPSLILSVMALLSSLYFSLKSIKDDNETKTNETESLAIKSIKESINNLLIEEEKLITITSNQFTDINTKTNAGFSFSAKVNSLIDKISTLMNEKRIKEIEPHLLINYGRILISQGAFSEAHIALENSLEKATNPTTKLICYRSLANIIANPSYVNFDSIKSRNYRKKTIEISKTFSGELGYDNISRSYELWAIDEYYFLKNKTNGNKLIDSSKYYLEKVQDLNVNKTNLTNRLTELYNYYNEILVTNNLSGEYSFYSSDKKKGKAYISGNTITSNINIDFYKEQKLYGKIVGTGNLTTIKELKFEVEIILYNQFSGFNKSGGTLILRKSKNRKLIGYFYEVGKSPIKYYLTKKK